MAVTPLTNRPVPPNSNLARAMFVWVPGSNDPLAPDSDQTSLLNFCSSNGCNVVFIDIWTYLGGANWTNSKRDTMKTFVNACHLSGIRVYALAGNVDWGTNQQWVLKNILEPIMAFNAIVAEKFDGIVWDIEYWTDEMAYPPSTHVPAICDLVKAAKKISGLPVGLFSAFFLKDNTGTRPTITYAGKTAQDGEHFMDVADFIVVGAYRDTAAAANPLFQPWYDYAVGQGRNLPLYLGVETINVSPSNITFYGQTKAAMETELTSESSTFKVATDSVFQGHAIHSYDGWKAMS